MKLVKFFLALMLVFALVGCSSGPSDKEVEQAFKKSLKQVTEASMGMAVIELKSLTVGDVAKVSGTKDTYEVEVTTVAFSKMFGQEKTATNSAVVKLRKIGNEWVLLE